VLSFEVALKDGGQGQTLGLTCSVHGDKNPRFLFEDTSGLTIFKHVICTFHREVEGKTEVTMG
jgi:hypothetical protein